MDGRVAAKSKLLFNNVHMLAVARAIGVGEEVVDSKTLQMRLALGQSAVQRILVILEGVGLMERLKRQARTEPVRYRRVTHAFWDAIRALADA
ncbi:hypothetical protein LLS1_01630 [Leifsonia sp. LS1]|nr:hypothetical protein LLS1_01630 [Leifsonia sp. LS1]